MRNVRAELERKYKLRMLAKQWRGTQTEIPEIESDRVGEFDIAFAINMLAENLSCAYRNSGNQLHHPIASRIPGISAVRRALRKLIFVLFGWLINPVIEQQNQYNHAMADTATLLRQLQTWQQQQVDEMKKQQNNHRKLMENAEMRCTALEECIESYRQVLEQEREYYQRKLEQQVWDLRLSTARFERALAPQLRTTRPYKNVLSVPVEAAALSPALCEAMSAAKNSEKTCENLMTQMADAYEECLNANLCYEGKKRPIVLLCNHFYNEYGLEAIKNETGALFALLTRQSEYAVQLVSLEEDTRTCGDNPNVHYVTRGQLKTTLDTLNPALVVIMESTPYLVFDFENALLPYHLLLRLSAQNPLQGLDEHTCEELLHFNDYGKQTYAVESLRAAQILEQRGFTDVHLCYPPVEQFKILARRYTQWIGRPVVGFASSPMLKNQLADRGADLLCGLVTALPEFGFLLLWRNPELAVPKALANADNCKICYGKYDMEQFYKEISCLLIPYATEDNNHACSLSAIEAMLNDIPVVATSVSGVSDLVRQTGFGGVAKPEVSAVADMLRQVNGRNTPLEEPMRNLLLQQFNGMKLVDLIEEKAQETPPRDVIMLGEWARVLAANGRQLLHGTNAIKENIRIQELQLETSAEGPIPTKEKSLSTFKQRAVRVVLQRQFKGQSIQTLHIATGNPEIVQECLTAGTCVSVTGAEEEKQQLQQLFGANENFSVQICDYSKQDLAQQFDAVTALGYLWRFSYVERCALYARIQNNLRTGGLLLFDVPNAHVPIQYREGDFENNQLYEVGFTKEALLQELTEQGFEPCYLLPVGAGILTGLPQDLTEEPLFWTIGAVWLQKNQNEKA